MKLHFDSALFMELPSAVESKTLADFLRPLNISRNTWNYWVKNGDLPLVKMLGICSHYGYDPSIFMGYARKCEAESHKLRFRDRLFSDALSVFRHLTVSQVCRSLGISTATFTRQLRSKKKDGAPSLTVQRYLEWCAKAGLNPEDYIYDGDVDIKLKY